MYDSFAFLYFFGENVHSPASADRPAIGFSPDFPALHSIKTACWNTPGSVFTGQATLHRELSPLSGLGCKAFCFDHIDNIHFLTKVSYSTYQSVNRFFVGPVYIKYPGYLPQQEIVDLTNWSTGSGTIAVDLISRQQLMDQDKFLKKVQGSFRKVVKSGNANEKKIYFILTH